MLPHGMAMSVPNGIRLNSGRISEAGFSLIELMIAIVIMIIGTVIAVPAYNDWAARADLRQAASEVHSVLTLGRVAAMNRNNGVIVTLAMVAGNVQIDTGGVMPSSTMGNNVTGFAGGPIQFSSLGLRVGGGAGNQLITLANSRGLTYSVVVTPGGKVSWCPQPVCP